jgi:hypothetical protein
MPFTRKAPSGGASRPQPNADLATAGAGSIHHGTIQSMRPSSSLAAVQSTGSRSQTSANLSLSEAAHVVDIAFSPRFFEVCINVGNHAIDHHEIDISRTTSDNELFELIWDKYNSSRGIGLRRLFLRPRSVHFVMVSATLLCPTSQLRSSSLSVGVPSTGLVSTRSPTNFRRRRSLKESAITI